MLTKLMPPQFGSKLLPRERLLHLKQKGNSSCHILVISAPAGYGKTVLALQFSLSIDRPLVWIQLDRHDNDHTMFLRILVEGLRQHWPNLGEKVIQLAAQGGEIGNNPRLIASLLINDLMRLRAQPVLVFDDMHELLEPSILILLQELLDNLPPGIFCVLAGRTAVPLNMIQLRATGQARFIGIDDLFFTRKEIANLLQERYGLQSEELVEEIERYTGGWPVALELSEALIPAMKSFSLQFTSKQTSPLYDYLASEVLEKQPPVHREFLLESAVLETLTAGQCDRLLERNDSASILEVLNEKHSLLIPLTGANNTYRLHQLFRAFLLQRLGSKRPSLLRRAGRLATQDGDTEIAIDYFLQAGFDAEASKLLEETGRVAIAKGHWHLVARWLDQLDDAQITGSPWLSYFRAVVEVYRGRLYEAQQWVEKANRAFAAISDSAGLMECRLLQGRLLRCSGRYEESLSMLEQAAALNEEQAAQRFDLILEKGYNLFLSGELPKAERFLMDALVSVRESGNLQAAAYFTEALGNICYQQGKHTRAMQLYQWCLRASGKGSLPGYYVQDAIPYIYCDWGELQRALDLAEKELAVKKRYRLTETLPSAYSTAAYVYFEMADYAKAEEMIRSALEHLYQYGEERFFLLINEIILAWCRLAQGHFVEARQLIDSTLVKAEQQEDQVCSMVQMLSGLALALMGSLEEAREILKRSEVSLEKMNFRLRLCDNYKALAYIYYSLGDMSAFQRYARKFLHLGSRMNYINNKLHFTAVMLEPIFRFSLEQDVETLYVQRMLSRLGSHSHKLLLELAGHPNPAVRCRVIAPLTELADDLVLQEIKKLARDSAPEVSKTAQAYLQLQTGTPSRTILSSKNIRSEDPRLEVIAFGSLRIFLDGKEISGWRTKKARELIGLLIHLGEPVGKERLKEELWPDIDSQASNALFGTTMYYLRKRFGKEGLEEYIQYRQGLYSLKTELLNLDYVTFEDLVNTGLHQEPLLELGAGLLGKAVRLYRGDYMSDPVEFAWALPRQVRLRYLYTEALLSLSRYYYSRRIYSRAQTYLLKLKEADPLYEPGHRLIMQIHANMGRQKALIEEHRNFKLLLMEETGLPPTPETEDLYHRLASAN